MVPKGWERLPIKEVCASIIDCVNKTAPVVDFPTSYKMIRTTNVRNGRVNTEDVRFVSEQTYIEWTRRGKPKTGDLIFTREAPVGEVGVLEDDQGVFLGQRTMMYRVAPEKANNYFVFYSLQTTFCQKQIENFSNGGTVSHMRVPDCGEIILNVPPLIEQNKIAKILSTWDEVIATTERLLDLARQQKKALMQQLLTGKKRFPGFEGEWKSHHLSDVTTIVMGSSPKSEAYNEDGVGLPLLQGNADIKNRRSAPRIFTSEITKECGVGDILLSVRAPVGTVAQSDHKACIGRGIAALKAKSGFDQGFIYQWLLWFEPRWCSFSQGSTFESINSDDIKQLKIRVPDLAEQMQISTVLLSSDQEIETLQFQLDGLKQEKKALMQALLTGRRRVQVAEAEVV